MSERFQREMTKVDADYLAGVGFSTPQINAMEIQILGADTIIHTKNRDVLRTVPYYDVKGHDDLEADYELIESGVIDPEATARMMRRTRLTSAILARTLHIGNDADWLDDVVSPHVHFGVYPLALTDPDHDGEPLLQKIKINATAGPNTAPVATTYVVKRSAGTLKGAPDVNIVRRQIFAGINSRVIDVRQHLGIDERHANDERESVIVPISTALIAHR